MTGTWTSGGLQPLRGLLKRARTSAVGCPGLGILYLLALVSCRSTSPAMERVHQEQTHREQMHQERSAAAKAATAPPLLCPKDPRGVPDADCLGRCIEEQLQYKGLVWSRPFKFQAGGIMLGSAALNRVVSVSLGAFPVPHNARSLAVQDAIRDAFKVRDPSVLEFDCVNRMVFSARGMTGENLYQVRLTVRAAANMDGVFKLFGWSLRAEEAHEDLCRALGAVDTKDPRCWKSLKEALADLCGKFAAIDLDKCRARRR